jgi:hypothetical protein
MLRRTEVLKSDVDVSRTERGAQSSINATSSDDSALLPQSLFLSRLSDIGNASAASIQTTAKKVIAGIQQKLSPGPPKPALSPEQRLILERLRIQALITRATEQLGIEQSQGETEPQNISGGSVRRGAESQGFTVDWPSPGRSSLDSENSESTAGMPTATLATSTIGLADLRSLSDTGKVHSWEDPDGWGKPE